MGEQSTRLRLRVSPGSRRNEVVGRHGDAWKVRISAAPEQSRANDAVVQLLADHLDVPRRDVNLVSGHGGRDKIVVLNGLDLAEAERRLSQAKGAA